MTRRAPLALPVYLAAVCAVGLPMSAWVIASHIGQLSGHLGVFLLLSPLVVVGEIVPIRVRRGSDEEELTVSTTFAFALLLITGTAGALLAMALASGISDTVRRKSASRVAFNIAQYSLSLMAAAMVLEKLGVGPLYEKAVSLGDFGAFAAAAAAFFVVNNTLPGTAIALSKRARILSFLVDDLAFQAGTAAVLMSMAPLVVAAANDSLLLVLLVVCPLAAVYKSADTLARTAHEALHDPLTGLPNRAHFHNHVNAEVATAAATNRSTAVMLMDLDRFKEVNDTLGHHTGDQLLQAVAGRLQGVLRPQDFVARLGGDEFAVVVPDVELAQAEELAVRLLSALEAPTPLSEVTLDVTASIGVALCPSHATKADDVLRLADAALYQAKGARSGYQLFDPDLQCMAKNRRPLLKDLHRAVDEGEFVVYYQPKADARTGRMIGAEALVRWQHPKYGLLTPDDFIGLVEQSGRIRQLTLSVVEEALRQVGRWEDQGFSLHVAVNLSVRNLHDPTFPSEIAKLLDGCGRDPSCLQLEITEGIVMADPPRVTAVLTTLKAMGVSLALDDFGTGYSSLSYLGRLPLDELKIDRSFVQGMITNASDAVIVRSTIELARSLGLRTVAEGLEDETTWAELRALGCDVVQGYLLSRPKPPEDITALLLRLDDTRFHVGPRPSHTVRHSEELTPGQMVRD